LDLFEKNMFVVSRLKDGLKKYIIYKTDTGTKESKT